MKNVLITGGAGFIGSNLTGVLLKKEMKVLCVDDFTLGSKESVEIYKEYKNYSLYEMDVTDTEKLVELMKQHKIDMVFHFAANSDIQKGGKLPEIDLKNTFQTTVSVLEAMRIAEVKQLFFASTSAVYGEKQGVKLKEETGGLAPISYYGGAKLASEAMISSYAHMNELTVTIFRFANVIGPGLTHGVIYDFEKKLENNSKQLEILGDGTQRKPYIYVYDLIDAMLLVTNDAKKGVEIYNAGVYGDTTVTQIADMVCRAKGLVDVKYVFTGGNRGWKGDVPSFEYDLEKINSAGWRAKYTSNEAVKKTLEKFLK